jgi:hypothetical protein
MFEVTEVFGVRNNPRYPYKWRVGYDEWSMSAVTHDDMLDWVADSTIPHVFVRDAIYFKTKEDVTLFLLRWS